MFVISITDEAAQCLYSQIGRGTLDRLVGLD
jgi:hypothetical protein